MSQVTPSQHTVVQATKYNSDSGNATEVNSDSQMTPTTGATIAAISDQAFTRHQYHRRIRTRPMPAPDSRMSSQAWRTVSR